MTNTTKGFTLASVGALFWGASGVAAQYLFHEKLFTPEWLVVIRMLSSGLILLAIDASKNYDDIFSIWKSSYDRWQLLFFGIFGMLSVQYTYFAAINAGNAATATILQYLAPVVIVCYLTFRYRRLPQKAEVSAILLAVIGTFLLVTKGDFTTLSISDTVLFWGILSAFCAAFYTVQPKYLLHHWRSPLVIGWGMLIGSVILLPVAPPWDFTGIWDWQSFFGLLFVIIFGTVVAFWSYLESIKYIRPTQTSTLGSLEPLSAVALSVFLLNVPFGLIEALGSAMILSTVFCLSRVKK